MFAITPNVVYRSFRYSYVGRASALEEEIRFLEQNPDLTKGPVLKKEVLTFWKDQNYNVGSLYSTNALRVFIISSVFLCRYEFLPKQTLTKNYNKF